MQGRLSVDHGRMLETLRVEADLLLDAARRAPADRRVPACPGLTIGETVRHVGSVYRMVVSWLAEGDRPRDWQRDPAPGQTAEEYFLAGAAALRGELARRDPASPAGTWWPEDRTAGFWLRRMVHETTVHRTDVQSAAGVPAADFTPVADDIAVDGIDEVLTLWFGHRLGVLGVSGTREGSVLVRGGDRRWLARAGPGGTESHPMEPGAEVVADATVTGSPMGVYLWLWGRLATSTITTEGDEDAVAQLWALLRLATR